MTYDVFIKDVKRRLEKVINLCYISILMILEDYYVLLKV